MVGFMKKLMEIKDLYVESQHKILLNPISLNFYEGISVFICGTSASGKTAMLKRIAGLGKHRGNIKKYGKVEVLLENNDCFIGAVKKALNYENLEDAQKKMISKFISKPFLEKDIGELDDKTKVLVRLCKSFCNEPELLCIDNILNSLDMKTFQKIFDYMKKNHITFVCVSTDIEKALYFDYMVVMDKGSIAIEGKTLQVLEQEKILKRLGIGLPFYVDLSIQLKLYGLIDTIYQTKEELRDALWK